MPILPESEYEVCVTSLYMTSTGYQTPDRPNLSNTLSTWPRSPITIWWVIDLACYGTLLKVIGRLTKCCHSITHEKSFKKLALNDHHQHTIPVEFHLISSYYTQNRSEQQRSLIWTLIWYFCYLFLFFKKLFYFFIFEIVRRCIGQSHTTDSLQDSMVFQHYASDCNGWCEQGWSTLWLVLVLLRGGSV